MTKDEALRMALNWLVSGNFVYPTALRTAIEEALALTSTPCEVQPEQEQDEDYDALSQKHLASIKRDTRVSFEDAVVRATHKVMANQWTPKDMAYRPGGLAQPSKNAGEDQVPTKGEKL